MCGRNAIYDNISSWTHTRQSTSWPAVRAGQCTPVAQRTWCGVCGSTERVFCEVTQRSTGSTNSYILSPMITGRQRGGGSSKSNAIRERGNSILSRKVILPGKTSGSISLTKATIPFSPASCRGLRTGSNLPKSRSRNSLRSSGKNGCLMRKGRTDHNQYGPISRIAGGVTPRSLRYMRGPALPGWQAGARLHAG